MLVAGGQQGYTKDAAALQRCHEIAQATAVTAEDPQAKENAVGAWEQHVGWGWDGLDGLGMVNWWWVWCWIDGDGSTMVKRGLNSW